MSLGTNSDSDMQLVSQTFFKVVDVELIHFLLDSRVFYSELCLDNVILSRPPIPSIWIHNLEKKLEIP